MKTLYKAGVVIILLSAYWTTEAQDYFQTSRLPLSATYHEKTTEDSFEPQPGIHTSPLSAEGEVQPAACAFQPKYGTSMASADPIEEQYNSHGIDYRETPVKVNMMECVESSGSNVNAAMRQTYTTTLIKPKYIAMSSVLAFSNQEAESFFPVYARYEAELSLLLQLTADPDALAPQQQQLKDKYFDEMNSKSGPYMASRFLAWENYYSLTCKAGE